MLTVHGLPLLLQAGAPLALLAWQVMGPNRSLSGWLIKTTLVAGYLGAVHRAGLWLVLPRYTALVFLVLLAVTALWQARTIRTWPWQSARRRWMSAAGRTLVALGATAAVVVAAAGRRPPPGAIVDLEFPLRDGDYSVVAGGSVNLLNPHLRTLTSDRLRPFRGQSYGVDLVKLGPFGLRASGLLPRVPARYAIHGDPVFSPCDGRVVQAEDDAPDMPPPQPDRTRMAGNHVLLDCGGVHVLLAHLAPGTVQVRAAQRVGTDTLLGRVGNSGNSHEPHLHIHAQRPAATTSAPLSGDPLAMRFGGRYHVRNDRIRARAGLATRRSVRPPD